MLIKGSERLAPATTCLVKTCTHCFAACRHETPVRSSVQEKKNQDDQPQSFLDILCILTVCGTCKLHQCQTRPTPLRTQCAGAQSASALSSSPPPPLPLLGSPFSSPIPSSSGSLLQLFASHVSWPAARGQEDANWRHVLVQPEPTSYTDSNVSSILCNKRTGGRGQLKEEKLQKELPGKKNGDIQGRKRR